MKRNEPRANRQAHDMQDETSRKSFITYLNDPLLLDAKTLLLVVVLLLLFW